MDKVRPPDGPPDGPVDEATARALVLASLPTRHAWAISSCELSSRGTHWILTANTEAYVRTGDITAALVGCGEHLVDRATGQLESIGGWQSAESVLEDRHDEAQAAGRRWVVRPRSQTGAADILRLRQWLGCPPERARALLRGGAWFVGPRRVAQETLESLLRLGLAVELALVEDAGAAIDRMRIGGEVESLRQALLEQPLSPAHPFKLHP